MDVPSREEFNLLQEQTRKQSGLIQELLERIMHLEEAPCEWYMESDFRKKFYPLTPASTFNGWKKKWIENGTLVQNQNCRYAGTTLLISSLFAKAINPTQPISHLRKTG